MPHCVHGTCHQERSWSAQRRDARRPGGTGARNPFVLAHVLREDASSIG